MVLDRLLWRVTCPNHASFRLLTVARKGSCGSTRMLILLHTQLLVLCSKSSVKAGIMATHGFFYLGPQEISGHACHKQAKALNIVLYSKSPTNCY